MTEKAVQIAKHGLKKVKDGTLNGKLSRLLFTYRITTHSTTGISPSELLMKLKSLFDLLKPNIAVRVEEMQQEQKCTNDFHAVSRTFQEGDTMYARDFHQGQSWLTGIIVKCSGPVSYKVKIDDSQLIHRHQDQLGKRSVKPLSWHNDSVNDDRQINPSPPPLQHNPPRRCHHSTYYSY